MNKRSKSQQSRHDKAVEQLAKNYLAKGLKVRADLKGYKRPDPIKDKIPDIVAVGNGEKIIVEVETKGTLKPDKEQRQVFREYAGKRKDTRFWTKTV